MMRRSFSPSHFKAPGILPAKSPAGFTLVELVVAIGVLVLLVTMVTMLTNSAGTTVSNSGKHMDADTQARLVFNRMAVDFSRMLKRADLDYSAFKHPAGVISSQNGAIMSANLQEGSDRMAFYSEADGYFSGPAQPAGSQKGTVSLVAYQIAGDPFSGQAALRRMGKGLGWEPNASGAWGSVAYLPVTMPDWYQQLNPGRSLFDNIDPDYKTVGDQVFRIEYTYLLKSTSTQPSRLSVTPWDLNATPARASIDGFKDVAAIVVTLAVLDPTSRVIVTDYSKLTGNSIFKDAENGVDVASQWNAAVNSPNFATNAGIPTAAAAAVRIYQRYFHLDTP